MTKLKLQEKSSKRNWSFSTKCQLVAFASQLGINNHRQSRRASLTVAKDVFLCRSIIMYVHTLFTMCTSYNGRISTARATHTCVEDPTQFAYRQRLYCTLFSKQRMYGRFNSGDFIVSYKRELRRFVNWVAILSESENKVVGFLFFC